MHLGISTFCMSVLSPAWTCVCPINRVCMNVWWRRSLLFKTVYEYSSLSLSLSLSPSPPPSLSLSPCVLFVSVWHTLPVSPQTIRWGRRWALQRMGGERYNEWHWRAPCSRAPRRLRDTADIADSRCVSNCRGVGRPGYVSVSACQESKAPSRAPNHCF